MVGLAMLIAIFGIFFPLFNCVFRRLRGAYQILAISAFLFARIVFEGISKLLARKLGANMYPLTVALAVYSYEFSMCVMMGFIKSPIVLVMFIGVDMCENAYHVWCLWKQTGKADSEGRRLFISSVVLLREFVEMAVPVQLGVIILAFHFGPAKQFNQLVSALPQGMPPELCQILMYLGIDIMAEVAVFYFTCTLLRAQGLKPLRLLRGVLAANLGSYFVTALACMMFYLQLQHSHFGCDFDFQFLWVAQEGSATWSQGTVWSA